MYFTALLIDLLSLYTVYMLNVSDDPAYMSASSSVKTRSSTALFALLIVTAILLAIYLVFFAVTLFRNFLYICQLTPRSRGLFLFSIAMLFTCIGTVIFGVYSPLYSNGHLFIFFIALCNIYVWALLYLNWPEFEEGYYNNQLPVDRDANNGNEIEM